MIKLYIIIIKSRYFTSFDFLWFIYNKQCSISSSDTWFFPLRCILPICLKMFCKASTNLSKYCCVILSFCNSSIWLSIPRSLFLGSYVASATSSFENQLRISFFFTSNIFFSISFFSIIKSFISSLFPSSCSNSSTLPFLI